MFDLDFINLNCEAEMLFPIAPVFISMPSLHENAFVHVSLIPLPYNCNREYIFFPSEYEVFPLLTSLFLFAGFCGETEEEHEDTLSLVKAVGYDMAYMFAYSMREKTHANRNYDDDVPEKVKQRRLTELIEAFRESTGQCYDSQVGTTQLVLVEGPNKRAPDTELIGKSDRGHRVSFVTVLLPHRDADSNEERNPRNPVVGDYVEVCIQKSTRASLYGEAVAISKLSLFYNNVEEEAVACGSRS